MIESALPAAGPVAAPVDAPPIRLRQQLWTCAAMGLLAALVLALRGAWTDLLAGPPLHWQAALGVGVGACAALASWIGFRFHRQGEAARRTIDSYRRLDLSGANPLWIALAAGLGEELLFRGALQPWLGVWASSAVFVLAHVRAYRVRTFDRAVLLQAAGLLAASLGLAVIARYAGLLTAVLVHAAIDLVALLTIRALARATATA